MVHMFSKLSIKQVEPMIQNLHPFSYNIAHIFISSMSQIFKKTIIVGTLMIGCVSL